MLCNIMDYSSLGFLSCSSFSSISILLLLSSSNLASISAYKILTSMLHCEAKLPKNHRPTTESELICLKCMLVTEVSGLWRMGGVESVVLAGRCERLGVLTVSTKLLAIQYQPCFFPPPSLVMASLESGAVVGSQVSPWSALPISVYAVMRVWMLGLV